MTSHAHEYVGRHRKEETPDDKAGGAIADVLRATHELFTHGTQPMHLKKEK
jgi:hypothetical protein